MILPLTALVVALLAWGVLSFGAVYAWAYWPLCIGSLVAGTLALARFRSAPGFNRRLAASLGMVFIAVTAQAVPVPEAALTAITPQTPETLRQLDPVFATGLERSHAISINPPSTWRAIGMFVSMVALMVGATSLFAAAGAQRLIAMLIILGVVVALIGIIQQPLYAGKIYGFWTPLEGREPFGPFVNRNHFAGWMLMTLPLALGYFCLALASAMQGIRPGVRERALWFSSPEANKLILVAMAAVTMAGALVMTMSRSGIGAMALGVLLTGWLFLRSAASLQRKLVAIAFLFGLIALVFVWVGGDAIVRRFAAADWGELNARRGAWLDALQVFSLFPVTGTGLNTYGDAMLLYQRFAAGEVHFTAAHNDYLQLLADGGLLVGIPALAAILALALTARRRLREDRDSNYYWLRAGAVTSLVAIGLQEIVEFSLQIPGNAALFAVVCGIAIHRRPPSRGPGPVAPGHSKLQPSREKL